MFRIGGHHRAIIHTSTIYLDRKDVEVRQGCYVRLYIRHLFLKHACGAASYQRLFSLATRLQISNLRLYNHNNDDACGKCVSQNNAGGCF
jgi:hypothetical protein